MGWNAPRLPAVVFRTTKSLRIISIFGGSTQCIEEPIEAIRNGIILANASPEMGEAVAEETLALILAAQYNLIPSSMAHKDSGKPDRTANLPNRSLTGTVIGLIGFGFIGRHVANMLKPFNVKLLIYDPYVKPDIIEKAHGKAVTLNELLTQSDIVSVHAGWTKETEGMLGATQLDLLKHDALVVSTARMPIFDQQALAQRVLAGKLRFASDFIPYNPTIWATPKMRSCPNIIAVHGGTSVTSRSIERMAHRVVTNIEQVFAGKMPDNIIIEEWIKRTT